tara:strand:+ start:162 stop:1664 length:1503 start_codon:yes stop_codon:yes gene_type:complete
MNTSYAIFEAEFRTSLRSTFQSFEKRFASTFFILILGLIFSFACIRLMNFVIQNPELFPEGSNEGYGTILLVYFSLFTLRSAGITYRKIVKSKIMDLYLVQPVVPRAIMLGQFFSVLVPNALITSGMLLIFFMGNIITKTNIYVEIEFFILMYLFSFLSALSGFMFSLIGSLYPFSRKLSFLIVLFPILLALLLVSNAAHQDSTLAIIIVLVCSLLLLIFFYFMDNIFVEALESYKINSSSHKNPVRILKFNWLSPIVGRRASAICSKEVTSSIRERDVLSSAFSTFSISLLLVFWWFKVGIPTESVGDLPPKLYYPGMLAISLYLGALLQCTMLGSTILGVEGKRLWIMKSNPVESLLIMRGKAFALLFMALPGLLSIWIPICILAKFPLGVTLFFGECVFILLFVNTGLGIWAGSAFANFDESDRGNPDILVQFMLMGTSAFFSSILLILPASVMLYNHNLGLLAGAIFLILSYAIMITGIRAGSSAYRNIYIDSYGA